MVHVSTIHHRDPRWIEPQLRYLERHTAEPYRVYAHLEGIGRAWDGRFDYVDRAPRGIAEKHNHLGEAMCEAAGHRDPIAFMHGDTLPIAEWAGPVRGMLERGPLVAVRRDENAGEPIPHPCFTVTTAGFWREIGGDWHKGPEWTSAHGKLVSDFGARICAELERRGLEWVPLLRSNRRNLHPLWFAVYGELVYHHGAGFRRPMSRADAAGAPPKRGPANRVRRFVQLRRARRRNERIGNRLYERLLADEGFYRELL